MILNHFHSLELRFLNWEKKDGPALHGQCALLLKLLYRLPVQTSLINHSVSLFSDEIEPHISLNKILILPRLNQKNESFFSSLS